MASVHLACACSTGSSSISHEHRLRAFTSAVTSFPWQNPRRSPSNPRVSLQEAFPQSSPAGGKSGVWINPNNPRASRLRSQSSESRYARLSQLAEILDSCGGAEAEIAEKLSDALGEKPSEQDAVILLNNMGNPDAAVLSLRWLREKIRVRKDVILYNVTLKVMRKCRNWDRAEILLNEMLELGIPLDNVTFSTIISCARVCNLPEKAVQWFERMEEFNCQPDDVTYSAMIDAYGRSSKVDMAMKLYDRAREEKRRLDPVTFSTVIKVYSTSNNFDGALNVFEEMKALGVKPNLITYNTLLDAMGRAGRPWQVKTIYREMESNGFSPNRTTYAALVRAFGRARYAEDALRVYREMKEKGMELNVVLCNTLLAMCADLGYVDEAMEIFEEMKRSPEICKPDSWTYSSLITIYSCSGQVAEAEAIFNEMISSGFEPNIFILTSLIQCYGKAKKIDSVVGTFDRMLNLGITPDDRFCGCLLNVLTESPAEEVKKVIDCVARAKPSLGHLVEHLLDRKASDETVKLQAEELFSNITKEVKKAYCNCLIDLCVKHEMVERACILLDMAMRLGIYSGLQTKTATQWSLHVRSLSLGAALTALHVWMNDLSRALEDGEDLPPLLGINTGHGKHRYSDRGLASTFESKLRKLDAPFHEAPDKVGWFLTTKVAAKPWLESRSLAAVDACV